MINKAFLSILLVFAIAGSCIAQASQEKSVTVFGAKINYVEAGDPAKPAVILLHGLGGNATNWAFTVPALSQNYHVFVPDQIGFGKSSCGISLYLCDRFFAKE